MSLLLIYIKSSRLKMPIFGSKITYFSNIFVIIEQNEMNLGPFSYLCTRNRIYYILYIRYKHGK